MIYYCQFCKNNIAFLNDVNWYRENYITILQIQICNNCKNILLYRNSDLIVYGVEIEDVMKNIEISLKS